MSVNAAELSDKRGVIHSFPWITPLLLGISGITLQNLSLHFHPLYHLQPCKFFSFLLLQRITDRMHQIRIHRYRNILKRIRPLLCLLDICGQTVRRVLHLVSSFTSRKASLAISTDSCVVLNEYVRSFCFASYLMCGISVPMMLLVCIFRESSIGTVNASSWTLLIPCSILARCRQAYAFVNVASISSWISFASSISPISSFRRIFRFLSIRS